MGTTRNHPVLERHPFHTIEFGDVVRDQPESEAARVSGNEEIVGANHLVAFLQVSADMSVMGSSVVGKVQDRDVGKKRLQSRGVLRAPRGDTSSP